MIKFTLVKYAEALNDISILKATSERRGRTAISFLSFCIYSISQITDFCKFSIDRNLRYTSSYGGQFSAREVALPPNARV